MGILNWFAACMIQPHGVDVSALCAQKLTPGMSRYIVIHDRLNGIAPHITRRKGGGMYSIYYLHYAIRNGRSVPRYTKLDFDANDKLLGFATVFAKSKAAPCYPEIPASIAPKMLRKTSLVSRIVGVTKLRV